MAEGEQGGGGMGVSDWLRTALAGFTGGIPGLAFSPAASPTWDRAGNRLGMEGDQVKSLGRFALTALAGGGLLPLLQAGWGVAKNYAVPTEPRWWDTPASPYGANYGRSDLQGQEMGGPSYLAQPWSPGMNPASFNRHDVSVGAGTEWAVQGLMDAPPAALGRLSGKFGRMGQFNRGPGGQVNPSLMGMGSYGPPMGDPFTRTRELLGMAPSGPDFAAVRARLGMGG